MPVQTGCCKLFYSSMWPMLWEGGWEWTVPFCRLDINLTPTPTPSPRYLVCIKPIVVCINSSSTQLNPLGPPQRGIAILGGWGVDTSGGGVGTTARRPPAGLCVALTQIYRAGTQLVCLSHRYLGLQRSLHVSHTDVQGCNTGEQSQK